MTHTTDTQKENMKISKQKLIEALEKEKKSVKELFPDAIATPTPEFAQFVLMKDQYNKAIDKAISIVNSMKGEE